MRLLDVFLNVPRTLRALSMGLPLVAAMGAGAAFADTANFTAPGAATWTVPAGVTSLAVVAKGAGGGSGDNGELGGNGGVVTATLSVTPGQVLSLYVGGGGGRGIGAWKGGGGGGSTNIDAGTANQIIAGGGGGGGGGSSSGAPYKGGDGNGSAGSTASANLAGGGGSAGAGGAAGTGTVAGAAGVAGNGGPGGASNGAAGAGTGAGAGGAGGATSGGGGGGGYGGGGGGAGAAGAQGAGGGGGGSVGPAGAVVSVGTNGGANPASNGGDGSIVFTYTVNASVPSNPIPNIASVSPVLGIGTQPIVLDLSAGDGPTMTTCLMTTVRTILGADAVYLGQTANGGARISQGGKVISFYPLDASTNNSQSADIHLGGTNVQNIGTSCGNFNIAPAIYNLTEFGAVLNSSGLAAQISSQGVITLMVSGTVYVARPDYLVTLGVAGAPSLVQGADGLYRFTDSAGNIQILRPAFVDTFGLLALDQLALSLGGWTTIQTDGTALFTTFNGTQFVLTPDLALSAAPTANAASFWWQDAPNHYMFRSSTLTLAQGFTVQPR